MEKQKNATKSMVSFESRFNETDFMLLFVSTLLKNGVKRASLRRLINFINKIKKENKFDCLLNKIRWPEQIIMTLLRMENGGLLYFDRNDEDIIIISR